jgi:hypothetical protein
MFEPTKASIIYVINWSIYANRSVAAIGFSGKCINPFVAYSLKGAEKANEMPEVWRRDFSSLSVPVLRGAVLCSAPFA